MTLRIFSPKHAMTPVVAPTPLKLLPRMKCWIQSIGKGNPWAKFYTHFLKLTAGKGRSCACHHFNPMPGGSHKWYALTWLMSENKNADKGAFFRFKCRSAKRVSFLQYYLKGYYFQEPFQSKRRVYFLQQTLPAWLCLSPCISPR